MILAYFHSGVTRYVHGTQHVLENSPANHNPSYLIAVWNGSLAIPGSSRFGALYRGHPG